MKKIELDISSCCACGACAVACMDENDIDVAAGMHPYRTVFRQDYDRNSQVKFYSIACMHCTDAPCVQACPSGCLYKDPETGLTLYDNELCIGCHSCAMACPFGAPTFRPDNKMYKCDGCIDRQNAGLEPACVRACAFQALKLVDVDDNPTPVENSLIAICSELVKNQK